MQPFASPGNQPTGFNVPRKKIVPYGSQEDVVETFCRIRTGQLTSPEQIPATVQDNFRTAAEF
ncbi:MAG: hypothetical protein JOZ18_16780, partial [Chloroflexi bacterium]|nr:hypothetical protein [Chloroflexota bacterium]